MTTETFDDFMMRFEEKSKEFFKIADLNGDGEISKKEWKKCEKIISEAKHQTLTNFEKEEKMKEFKILDVDGSGSITEEEFVNGSKKLMEELRELAGDTPQAIKSFGNYVIHQMEQQMEIIKNKK
jgi:Ca2+-binding EF-hand superfamily protein